MRALGRKLAGSRDSSLPIFLAFIREFLAKLKELENSEKATHACQAAYNDTLAKFHPWLVRKAAQVRVFAVQSSIT